jgi:hypothetical protein
MQMFRPARQRSAVVPVEQGPDSSCIHQIFQKKLVLKVDECDGRLPAGHGEDARLAGL